MPDKRPHDLLAGNDVLTAAGRMPGNRATRLVGVSAVAETVTRRITYQGSVPIVGALKWALEGEGVAVSVRRSGPPLVEHHEARTISEPVVVTLSVDGRREAIEAGVRRFRVSFPSGEVEVEGAA